MSYIEDLMQFGLTRQESAIYYALLSEGMMTGYEAAKVSGVSLSAVSRISVSGQPVCLTRHSTEST